MIIVTSATGKKDACSIYSIDLEEAVNWVNTLEFVDIHSFYF